MRLNEGGSAWVYYPVYLVLAFIISLIGVGIIQALLRLFANNLLPTLFPWLIANKDEDVTTSGKIITVVALLIVAIVFALIGRYS